MIAVSKACWCNCIGGVGRVIGEFRSRRGGTGAVRGKGTTPQCAGRILLMESEREGNLTVGQVGRSGPLGVFTHIFFNPWGHTVPWPPSG